MRPEKEAAMEPISAIVAAIAIGAAAALKEVSAQSVKDAYAGLKALIQRKYTKISLAQLEDTPGSTIQRAAVEESLKKTDAEHDQELLLKVKEMMDAVRAHAPQTAAAIGVDIEDIKSTSLRIANIVASGPASGVIAKRVDVSGPISIEGVHVGGADPSKKS
jgi:hypothetical protein